MFKVSDGDKSVTSYAIDIVVIKPEVIEDNPWLLGLVALIAAIGGALSVLTYWKLTHYYNVNQVFLIYENGILIAHKNTEGHIEIWEGSMSDLQGIENELDRIIPEPEEAAPKEAKEKVSGMRRQQI